MKKDMEKNMLDRGEKLLDAIGDIKDEYIVEANTTSVADRSEEGFTIIEGAIGDVSQSFNGEPEFKAPDSKNKQRTWMKIVSAAAVLVLCVGIGSVALNSMKKNVNLVTSDVNEAASEEVRPESAPEGSGLAIESGMEEKETVASESYDDFESAYESEGEVDMETIEYPYEPTQGEAFVLTAAQWNDNANWPFFVNLVNSERIVFPSYGIDPRNRIKVTLLNEDGSDSVKNESVYLKDEGGNILWQTKSNKEGNAYLFYEAGTIPFIVEAGGTTLNLDSIGFNMPIEPVEEGDEQGTPVAAPTTDDIVIHLAEGGEEASGVQVMFIVDTTGSMGDELSYLQMDFSQIAADTAGEGVYYSANFYRDEGDVYVTKTNGFTSDVGAVQRLISEEYATGGGDTPEAVADILYETITANSEWRSDMNKVCFLIFDAPPHYGTEQRIAEAVESAATRGIHIVPVVASNAERETELFGRALAICTDGEYVFLTDHSGVGNPHLEPIVGDYNVELLHDIIVRIINNYK